MEVFNPWGYPKIMHLSIGFSIINHPFWGAPISGHLHILEMGLSPNIGIGHVLGDNNSYLATNILTDCPAAWETDGIANWDSTQMMRIKRNLYK